LLKQDIKWILPDSLVIKETETTKILIGQDTYWVMLSPELEPEIPKAYYTKFKKAMEKGGAIRALGVSGIKILKNLFEIKLPDLDPRVVCSKVILDASGKNKLLIFDKYLKTHEKVIDYTHPLEFIASNQGGEEFVELEGNIDYDNNEGL
jgi:hypothetical protein